MAKNKKVGLLSTVKSEIKAYFRGYKALYYQNQMNVPLINLRR